MDLLAAASDAGGITGFLLDLVDKLGAVGVGLSILAETVIPPIPSEAVLGLAGVLINDGRMSIVPVILFATLGSILGALFFYYVGRALGPRRSHAFLDRLPLVETDDVDKTFSWFETARPVGGLLRPHGADRAQLHLGAGGGGPDAAGPVPALHRRRQPDLEHRADQPGRGGRRLHPGEPALPGLRRRRGRRPGRRLVRLPQGDRQAAPAADGRRRACRPTSATRRHDPAAPAGRRLRRQRDAARPRAGPRRAGRGRRNRPPCCRRCSPARCSPGSPPRRSGRWCRFRDAFDAALAQESDLGPAARAGDRSTASASWRPTRTSSRRCAG